ncbi:unnamed protein product [Lepeophtheirus salmonis]|uniref:(salmon louse) hypothetical protein n=1 Tax=Lepeophtheirus salmonis TaxID=72036 RepID=A0A0K2T152_LEPSM|nr:unnamed protein product [Lepeophtheirus salmonis]CAF3043836.1 unnamed protein product [Lepeophtheirus salmonis]
MKWNRFIYIIFLWTLENVNSLRFQNRGSSAVDSDDGNDYTPKRRHRLSYQRPPKYDSGGYEGRKTSSLTGFEMGLGTGLTIGYGPNASGLKKPKPIKLPHEHQEDFDINHPATCTKAKSTNYLKDKDQRGAFDIDESTVDCEVKNNMNESSCFGKISIVEVNLTTASPSVSGYEIKITKGCGDKDLMEMELRAQSYRYDTLRRCWVSPIERDEKHAEHLVKDAYFLNEILSTSAIKGRPRVRMQSEICFCEGDYCNQGSHFKLTKDRLWMFISFSILISI